jgi:hypothetical protein
MTHGEKNAGNLQYREEGVRLKRSCVLKSRLTVSVGQELDSLILTATLTIA